MKVSIIRWVDDAQPGWVECALADAWGEEFTFIDKEPVFVAAPSGPGGPYPRPGLLACRKVRHWRDPGGRELVTIDTDWPWGVESTGGRTRFDVIPEQLTEG